MSSSYDYKRSTVEEQVAHEACTYEEWRAYVCDLSEAPSWVSGSDSGLCCHSHRVILVDQVEEVADLDQSEEEVPVEVDGPEYEYACSGSIVCEPLLDRHGRECERLNDEARADFYEDAAAARFGATAWTGVGR